jgi:hypothetical protein
MQPNWRIPAGVEEPFREALGHAFKHRISDLRSTLGQMSEEELEGGVGLCGLVSAYTVIDTVNRTWPTDTAVRHIAQKIAEAESRDAQYGVTEQNLYLWLSKCALGFDAYAEHFDSVFEDAREFLAAPYLFTGHLLARFHPNDETAAEFLNQIERAYEGAGLLDRNLLPALMVQERMAQALRSKQAAAEDATGD